MPRLSLKFRCAASQKLFGVCLRVDLFWFEKMRLCHFAKLPLKSSTADCRLCVLPRALQSWGVGLLCLGVLCWGLVLQLFL